MLSWLMSLIRRKHATPRAVPRASVAPQHASVATARPGSRGSHFDPALVQHLKDEHRALLTTFGSIKAAATQGQWIAVQTDLANFRSALTNHLVTESNKLYVHLQLSLAADRERLKTMRKFSNEMVGIGKVVLNLLDEYKDVNLHGHKQARFLGAWNELGKVLGDRVSREESTLYPMYGADGVHA